MASENIDNNQISLQTGIGRNTVKKWRMRWAEVSIELDKIESENSRLLRSYIERVLSNEQRSGALRTFTADQVSCIITIACQSPKEYGLPVSHWTPSELARQAIKQKIVESISPRQVGLFLKMCRSETSPKPLLVEPEHQ